MTLMTCTNCGAEIAEGSMFCTSCGTPVQPAAAPVQPTTAAPVQPGPDEPTVLLDPSVANAAPANMQVDMQPQVTQATAPQEEVPLADSTLMSNPFGQPVPPQPMNQAPQMGQPFGQPVPPQPMNQAPQMGQPFGQPVPPQPMNQAPQMGQPFGQPIPPQPMNQAPQMTGQPYGQPMMQQAPQMQPPKPPKKPLSPGAKKAILFSAIGAVVLAAVLIILLVVLPKSKKSNVAGSYKGTDAYNDTYTYVMDDGTYILYYDDIKYNSIEEAGTYVVNGDQIKFTDLEDYSYTATYSKKDNTITVTDWGENVIYESLDKKASIPFSLTPGYADELEKQANTAVVACCGYETIWEYLCQSSSTYVWDDDLKNPRNEFYEELAKNLNYANDITLQTLMEGGYVEIDIYMNNGNPEVELYIY